MAPVTRPAAWSQALGPTASGAPASHDDPEEEEPVAQVDRARLLTPLGHLSWDSSLDPHGRPEVRGQRARRSLPRTLCSHLMPTSPPKGLVSVVPTCHQQCQLPLPGA